MLHYLTLAAAFAAVPTVNIPAPTVSGQYLEARTCDIWTGPCFANAETHLTGNQAVLAWRIQKGTVDGVNLDGLGVVAVIVTDTTLGLEQSGPGKAVFIVDNRATAAQRDALVRLAQRQGGQLTKNVVAVQSAPVSFTMCACPGEVCAELSAGGAYVKTRCLGDHDKHCGNETAYYPPLTDGVNVHPAAAEESSYRGQGLSQNWVEHERRGAYVGTFAIR